MDNPSITRAVLDDYFGGFRHFEEPDLKSAKEAAIQFCLAMASHWQPARWLTFLGTSGGGKTYLSKLITGIFGYLDHLRDENQRPNERHSRRGGLKPWCEAVGEMRQGDFSGIYQLKADWFVCLDDIGAEHQSPMAVGKLYEIMTAREGKFTVLNANLTLEGLATLDVRLASRVKRHGSILVEIDTKDFNLRK